MNQPFSLDRAIELGKLCEQSYLQYGDYEKGKNWRLPDPYNLLTTFFAVYEGNHIPLGFIARKDNAIYVVWRGTDNLEEWVQDVKFDQKKCPFFDDAIKVELGFKELYISSKGNEHPSPREVCIQTLNQQENIEEVFVTGHSLGGALAVINALDMATNMSHVPTVYTLAGPRAGNHHFAFTYNQVITDSWRLVNSHDEVPKLPPKACPPIHHEYHYKHVNSEHPITFGNFWNLPHNHSLDNYMAKLES